MKNFALTLLFILSISGFVYSQNNCTEKDKERVKSIAQKVEIDNILKIEVEQEHFGDCVHYAWMDEMRKFNIKQVSAVLKFVWNKKVEKLEIKDIDFLQTYYRYNTEFKDKKLLAQFESNGLKAQLKQAILESAEKSVFNLIDWLERDYQRGLRNKEPKGRISGTIYVNLLDDEALPVLADMPDIDN